MDFIDQREIKFNVEKNSSTEILNFWKIGTTLVLLYSFSTVNNIEIIFLMKQHCLMVMIRVMITSRTS